MNIHAKILVDRTLGAVIVRIVNGLALIAGVFLGNRKLPSDCRTIVICKLIGMGSIIQSTPLVCTLKKNYPNAAIVFISTAANKDLLGRFPEVSSVLLINDRNLCTLALSTLWVSMRLLVLRPDLYLDLEIYSQFSAILTAMSLSRNRFGFFKGSFGYRSGIYTHLMYFNIKAPIARVYLQLASLAGCTSICENIARLSPLPEEERAMRARCGREGIGLETQYVVINPNASNLRIERRWCSVNFASLTGRLLERFDGLNAVFTGSGSERRYVSDVVKGISPQYGSRVVNMAGLLPIGELIALLSGARLFITNDSGPLHLAASLGKKTIALFGPCSPGQYGNMPGTISIYKNVYCSPCVHEFDIPPCKGDNACMKAIGVDDVFETAVCVLDEIPIDPGVPGIAYNHCVSERPLGIVVRDR